MKYLLMLVVLALPSFGSSHALAKTAHVIAAPVAHPKRTLKQIAGSVVFAAESGVDVAHVCLTALDNGTAAGNGEYFGPVHLAFHAGNVIAAKADTYLESAELLLFGSNN